MIVGRCDVGESGARPPRRLRFGLEHPQGGTEAVGSGQWGRLSGLGLSELAPVHPITNGRSQSGLGFAQPINVTFDSAQFPRCWPMSLASRTLGSDMSRLHLVWGVSNGTGPEHRPHR